MNTKRLYIYKIVTALLPESRAFGLKNALLRWSGARIGHKVRIYSSVKIRGNGELEIGNDVHIGGDCLLAAVSPAKITIKSEVDIAPSVMILTGTHKTELREGHMGGRCIAKSVSIGNGCWLCAGSIILPGVAVADKTVIGAGSVLTKSVDEQGCLFAGLPATMKKRYVI